MATGRTSHERREAIAAWLTANGIDVSTVPINSTIVEDRDKQVIRYTAIVRTPSDDPAVKRVEYDGASGRVIEWREVPIVVPAPEFPAP